ncbi:sulfatase family protein [Ruania alba]|uniref:Choline-sulfatase n=1 Tax=Ruania alba TaxID=648782 RepID=A0A1H5N7F7_9MICO|nr:sulfatase-like hydrolase/transferase [Ruania alba]SEE97476.1 choline-sulfatase [Ruania alba]
MTSPPLTNERPNILFVMTDQQRFDTIRSLGNDLIDTPNLDRLVERGVTFTNAYSTCPVCVPARYTFQSGSEPTRTDIYDNAVPPGGHEAVEARCGPYLGAAMTQRGYRTFGVGKFHTIPWNGELGYETVLYSEELYDSAAQRTGDAYASWIAREHPQFDWIEALMGERTEMYYMPQMSPLPPELTVESWATDRAIELIDADDDRPWFGLVSYIGPHPPFAPPLPFNRQYDPDRMPSPVTGKEEVDHLDQHIPWMNYAVFADEVDDVRARTLKARYYAEITYIDGCIGRLLDAVDARADSGNTIICFYSDHGELLGDHQGWQKESFFEASTRVPFLVSWPDRIPAGERSDALVALTDLFGIATTAAGGQDLRQGSDVLGLLAGSKAPRERLFGYHGRPGTVRFKAMVREGRHKLIWMANGGRRLLFDVVTDPHEQHPIQDEHPEVCDRLEQALTQELIDEGVTAALSDGSLLTFPYAIWPRERIYQFDRSRGVEGFPPLSVPDDTLRAPETKEPVHG